jgi:hypothetical protein
MYRFFVMPLPMGPGTIWFGRDLMAEYGIGLTFLPQLCESDDTLSSNYSAGSASKADPDNLASVTTSLPLSEDISNLLADNAAINARCTHPDSIVHLDTGNATPVFRRQYRVAESLTDQVSSVVNKWLSDGVIAPAPAGYQWNSPLLVVHMPDGQGIRVCLDPRPLNKVLVCGDNFPIPVIADVIDRFAGSVIFSALDFEVWVQPVHCE